MKARFFALAALVLGLASCQQEFDGAATQVGGEVDFQLKVDAKELATRATDLDGDSQYGYDSAFGAIDYLGVDADDFRIDWTDVDLRYTLEVYDADALNAAPVKDRQVIIVDKYEPVAFDLRLVPNREYQFVVFADFVENGEYEEVNPSIIAQAELGLYHNIGSDLRDITIKNDAINNETTDAYFASEKFKITNSAAQSIVLRRPYGKVRVIATDLDQLNINVEPKSVMVTYDAFHANAFNAVEGTIDGEYTTTKVYTNVYNDIKKTDMSRHIYTGFDTKEYKVTNANGEVRNTYMTLFTDYILAEGSQHTIHFTMEVFDEAGTTIKETHFNTDIPVQRNHLTTIVGNVLTTATEINVTIDDKFADKQHERNFVLVNTAKELKEALDAYKDGQTILFENNLAGDFTILQKEGVNVVIDGNGYEFDGIFTVNGDARSAGKETLTFQNINFRTQGSDFTFISAPSKINSRYNYSHNVTIKNCTFEANHTVGCASFTGAYNIVMENCKANNVHSIAQFQSIDNTVRVENIEVTNSKSGLAFGNTAYPTLKDAKIEVAEYGVRCDGNASRGNLVMNKVNIKASVPVIIRYVTTDDYTVNIDDTNTLKGIGYDVIFTQNKDDKTYVAPTATFIANVAEGIEVFPGENMYAYDAAMLQAFINNAVDGDVIEIVKDIEGDVTVAQKPYTNITINGNGFNYAGSIVVDGKSATYTTAGLTISKVNFKADSINADACIRLGNGDNNTRYTCNVTVKGCTFDVPGAVGVKSYTGGDKNLNIANCTATANAHSLLQAKGIDGIRVEGCTVNSKNGLNFNNSNNVVVSACNTNVRGYAVRFGEGSAATGGAETYTIENSSLKSACEEAGDAVIVLRGSADKATLNLVNTTIEGNPQIINNAAEAKVLVENEEAVTSAEALKAALANGGTITLGTNVEGTFTINKENTKIIGVNGATITGRVNVSNCDGTVFENLKFKINDASKHKNTFSGAPYQYPGIVVAYGAQMTFEGCEFECSIATGVCGINAGNHADSTDKLTVNNCKFVGDFYAIRTRTLFEITNNEFDIYTNQGTLAAVWTWGNANSGANTVTFTGNTNVNTNKVYGVQMTASTFVYDYVNINVQGNTNFHALADSVIPGRFNGTHTFVEGSETF